MLKEHFPVEMFRYLFCSERREFFFFFLIVKRDDCRTERGSPSAATP